MLCVTGMSASTPVDLYRVFYSHHAQRTYCRVREATYGVDLGQTGWMTAAELDGFSAALGIAAESRVLEVGCGAGGSALYLARRTGAHITGIDLSPEGIRNARSLTAAAPEVADRLHFAQADGAGTMHGLAQQT